MYPSIPRTCFLVQLNRLHLVTIIQRRLGLVPVAWTQVLQRLADSALLAIARLSPSLGPVRIAHLDASLLPTKPTNLLRGKDLQDRGTPLEHAFWR